MLNRSAISLGLLGLAFYQPSCAGFSHLILVADRRLLRPGLVSAGARSRRRLLPDFWPALRLRSCGYRRRQWQGPQGRDDWNAGSRRAADPCAAESVSVAERVARLNVQFAASSDGGFVTCLCARIAPDGRLTLANAGHLTPYPNGDQIPLDSRLPSASQLIRAMPSPRWFSSPASRSPFFPTARSRRATLPASCSAWRAPERSALNPQVPLPRLRHPRPGR
jgi:Stage II sporulation protein E (SpoIIE)